MKVELLTEELERLRAENTKLREENAYQRGRIEEMEKRTAPLQLPPVISPVVIERPYTPYTQPWTTAVPNTTTFGVSNSTTFRLLGDNESGTAVPA